jgi:hypothetical protein
MSKKNKKTTKATGRPIDDGELQAEPRRDGTNAEVPEEPGVAINDLRVTAADNH